MTTQFKQQGKVLTLTQQRLLDEFQHNFPLSATPYADIARKLAITEQEVIDSLTSMQESGVVSRVGPVFKPNEIGVSTLAAMAVPAERLDEVAELISQYDQVNHNYEREHAFNLWFVATAPGERELLAFLEEVEKRTGLEVLFLPMLEDYHIDLGFKLKWQHK